MEQYDQRSTDTPPKWRAWMHIGMGVVYLIFAAMVFNFKKFGNIDLPSYGVYGMGVILCLYGVFRLWRGVMDLRMINREQLK